jgi:hypothetical protein
MANNPTFTGFEPEVQDITRQREMAKMLLQKGMADNLQGQMVSGRYVGASPWQGIANMYAAYSGRQLAEEADKKQADLAKLLREGTAKDLLQYNEVWAAAGTWNDNFGAAPADIVRVAGGVVTDLKRA